MKCAYCDNLATKELTWIEKPIKVPWCGCDLQKVYVNYLPIEGIHYVVDYNSPKSVHIRNILLQFYTELETYHPTFDYHGTLKKAIEELK